MDTRLARKRRWTMSPEKKTARTSLNFIENTPPSKRKKESSTESDEDPQFNTKSFYGGREKKSFPHSPVRRKAASKILSKLDGDDEEEFLSLRKRVPGEVLKINNKVKEDIFKLSSTSSDSEPVEILKERNRKLNMSNSQKARSSKKASPPHLRKTSAVNKRSKVTVNSTQKSTTKSTQKSTTNSTQKSTTNSTQKSTTPVAKSNVTSVETTTPNSTRKFFKTKSPSSAPKTLGSSIIISKGFNLKFLPRRRSLLSSPKLKNSPVKMNKTSKTREVYDDIESRNSKINKTQVKSYNSSEIESSLDSGFDSRNSQSNSPASKLLGAAEDQNMDIIGIIHASPSKTMITKTGGGQQTPTRSSRKTVDNMLDTETSEMHSSPAKNLRNSKSSSQQTPTKMLSNQMDSRNSHSDLIRSPSKRESVNHGSVLSPSKSKAIVKSPKRNNAQAKSDCARSPAKKATKQINSHADSPTVSVNGSVDLFTDSCKSDDIISETSSNMSGPSLKTLKDDAVSETGSDVSGPTVRAQKFFSIFNGTPTSSPLQGSLNKSLSRGGSPRQSPRLRSKVEKNSQEQMVLDAGQKKFGAVQCEECGMVYRHADPSDETMHDKFHQNLLNVLKFPGWKKERVVQEFSEDCSRIIMILHDDPKYAVKKIEDINNIMGQEMGFPEITLAFRSKYKAFLFISEDKKVDGCCIAEPVTQGYKVIPDSQPSQSDNPQPGHRPWYCHPDPEPAAVGISRIWVFGKQRRRGVASKLLDAVRQWFSYGVYIEKNQIAFSDPTSDGRQLACKYTGVPQFLVYKYST